MKYFNRLFRVTFHKYIDTMRRLIQELEIKGIFKARKKKDSDMPVKKGLEL